MDPNLNYNFAYGDNYSGADPSNDPTNYQAWASSWTQPTSAATQGSSNFQSYPQYQSQHLQQQQQQAQQQAQNTYAALNPISTFMQQQQKPFQQQQQKKFGGQPQGGSFPKPGVNSRNFGAFGAINNTSGGAGGSGGGGIGPEWVQPMSQQSMMSGGGVGGGGAINPALRTFPGKNGGGGGGFQKPQWRQNKQGKMSNGPKKFDTTGKTPAMILHEVFKQVNEEYTEVQDTVPKRFRCTLTVEGRSFQMESPNKKAAKQKCAEVVVRELRPELHVTPFEEGINAKATPVKKSNGESNKRNAAEMMNQPPAQAKKTPVSAKKAKLPPLEAANSLLDLLMKLVTESEGKYKPVFEATELPREDDPEGDQEVKLEEQEELKQEVNEEPVEEEVKQEPMDQDVKPDITQQQKLSKKEKAKIKKPEVLHKCVLRFEEQGKEYTKIGPNRGNNKDFVVREALRDIFQVSQEDITAIARRHAASRLGSDMTILQCLNTIAAVLNCKVTLEAEPAEDTPIGVGRMHFMARCTVIDHNENDRQVETTSPSLNGKGMAKEYAASEMLKTYFKIDPEQCIKPGEGTNTQGPCATLHAMINKQSKTKEQIVYEFKENVPAVAGNPATVFYCDCIVHGERHTGSGRSKKIAKNEAAVLALKKIFKIDYDPNTVYPLALSSRAMTESKISPMCKNISEFCKREFHGMVTEANMHSGNQMAAFILVNEKDEKRLLSLCTSGQYIMEPDALALSNGTVLNHLEAIVLARRALIRVFIAELAVLNENPDACIFERRPDGKAALRPNFRLMLYANWPANCSLSVDDAQKKSLGVVRPTSTAPVPDDVLTAEQMREQKTFRVHCVADKIFKWNNLGIQGALLSNIIEPIFINAIYFGSSCPVTDESLKYALVNRLGDNESDRDVIVECIPAQLRPQQTYSQVWFRGSSGIEILHVQSGRANNMAPSKVSKISIFEEYHKLPDADKSIVNYAKAKENASTYQYEKNVLYGKLEAAGLGKWQVKPAEFVDSFTLPEYD
ncbi:hypothetical protein CAEBREN_07447 [Caenorhabditis brenneri]|uniref:Uncharacterized protein n=1 Tax=Caenorhabditis brenneri TaxID=135651 RepID=G0P5F5_CAEBE|nr:hypothetical protein CAEBREN_07447 [Caenorhabditis brenneri]